jgi:hypothetical protein
MFLSTFFTVHVLMFNTAHVIAGGKYDDNAWLANSPLLL